MAEQRVNILVYRPDGTLVAQYLLGDGEHLIGRDINCPVYLDSEHISFNHAKLHLSHDGIQIEDLNSTAGTYLDGVTVRGKLRIKSGQVLQVGDLTIYLQPESEGQAGPGSRLGDGRYTLIRMLGKGGMGEVWLAKDEQLDEEVALKKLPPEVGADAMALADMRREVQKSRALSHPNIVRIHDLVMQTGEDPLISLEYVDGTDLTAIAATKTNGIFSWSDIKDWILQLVAALEYAHEEKIVHRDLKPANIMISRKGRLKLADFGIAATVADATRRSSMEGFISGTTLYMSPQQMEGKPPKVTDDVYALGATLYELLTSRPPFYTGNVEHQVINVTPAPPSQRLAEFGFVGEIPPYVQELAMACLSKEPEGRPQTMGAVRQWIQTEGQATDAIPKPTTKTIKIAAPVVAVAGPAAEPVPVQAKAKGGIPAWAIYVMGIALVLLCFIVGKNCSGGKEEEATKGDKNGSAAVLPESLKKGLVAYFPFNGNAKDEIGNGNDGEVKGATSTADRHGKDNSAYSFDGENDIIDLKEHPQSNTLPITISFWVFTGQPDRPGAIIDKYIDGSYNGWALRMGGATGKIWPLYLGSLESQIIGQHHPNYPQTKQFETQPLTASIWHHCVFTLDSIKGNIFLNGKFQDDMSWVGPPQTITSSYKLSIGNTSDGPNQKIPFKGSIDDIRIYNRALTETEVKALYEFEKAG
jgi:serine/threonine protein kinase